ncbi:MAG: hypothetical protein UW64_C0003G0036 [Microgenomates group bacterium GW2011_GWC1_44_37]|uniref:Methyltransferase FkbM domain-containing protein n=1 Tax=Candidatus Collierbacteria bacterium GW2011_GWB2_44_22 TaxID=1618387 RepID=A0A0G1I0Y6_9BACT|nr:MAG: hypothetical protein UW31_C0005G0035 [Candidatus Collierbacteria bacterium GW2011_GWA2_44_13]KKT51471.1 MAG: hypothetical protein UW42_C0002G0004 [Candidatus Collierbacteria bacterium GW2011_GWB1_44_197]KKT52483.1 MAG: hypothetical protein UW44_C0001G0035 [Candidatus Collierbacteria bacterium GW2011_GWB2_44_22]KKT62706.1 MAG: hypothetical protein UW56_C0004G0019 [Candidatus Collierbacteria bacterium GW2011_GWD1_44_27]KKT66484.1 MAG: hypothetical protein UW58_C0007G0004 [Candidatus Colli
MKNTIKKIYNYGLLKSFQYLISEIKYIVFYRLVLGSYSQQQEDLIVDKIHRYKTKGFFVDIGANDPVRFNNTYRFYLKGWRGINVEPNTKKFERLKKIRPEDTNVNVGISGTKGKLSFYNFHTDTLSTFSKKEADNYVKQGFEIESIRKVDTLPLKNLLKKLNVRNIDFLTIDTEGYDVVILKSNDWEKYRPKVICVENITQNNTNENSEIKKLLVSQEYKLVINNGLNSIFKDARTY